MQTVKQIVNKGKNDNLLIKVNQKNGGKRENGNWKLYKPK